MKYESTILKRLIDTYGVVGNPRYISEIIKEFIVRGKGCFPNLFTYQADWLAHIDEFGLNPTYTVSYTGQSIYAPNTLERPVKSAILSGNTLVNLCNGFKNHVILDKNTPLANLNIPYKLQAKKYALICEVSNFNAPIVGVSIWITYSDGEDRYYNKLANTNGKLVYLFEAQKEIDEFRVYIHGDDRENGGFFGIGELMLIEYQDGMENWDIPYFEGMASVKMAVLTTSGKNLFDISSMSNINNWDTVVSAEIPYCSYKINLKPNTTYTFSQKQFVNTENVYASFGLEKGAFEYLLAITHPTNQYPTTFTLTTDDRGLIYVKLYKANTTLESFISKLSNNQLQLEEGSVATSYEPFKSNILSTPSDLELRGIDDVKDTLDCLTGKVTQRISEIVLNGSEETWGSSYETTNAMTFKLPLRDCIYKGQWTNNTLKNDYGFKQVGWFYIYNDKLDEECYAVGDNKYLHIRVLKSRLNSVDVNGFKSFLSANPITIQYVLTTESIKTVGLTIHDKDQQKVERLTSFEGGTHFTTSSQDGSLLPTLTVDVVTDLEETLAVCSLEGNTM